MVTKQALEQVTNAPYEREFCYVSPTVAALGTIEVPEALSNFILANGQQELFPWIRLNVSVAAADCSDAIYWYVVKQNSADPVPDMSDGAVLEALIKEHRIFSRGRVNISYWLATVRDWSLSKCPEVELHNVKLKDGEELRLLLLAVRGQAVNGLLCMAELEYRQTPTGA